MHGLSHLPAGGLDGVSVEKSDAPIRLPDNHADLCGGGPGGGAGGQLWAELAVGAAADLHSAAVSDPGADAVPQPDSPDGLFGPAAGGNAPDDGDDAVDGFPDAVWPERRGRLLALRGGGAYGSADSVAVCRNSGPGNPGSLSERPAAEPDPVADFRGFSLAAECLPCQAEGSIEYWTCDVCGLYFASADGSKSITATEIVLPKTDHSWAEGYLSDMTGHWHKCGVCGITSNTEKHASGGAATTERAEICTICGYEIAPKKPAASNDDDSSQASNTDQKATDAAAPPVATATPATPGVVKPSVIPVPPTTPTADENRKEDAAKPSGEAQDTQKSSGEAPQEERIDSMTAQNSGSQESGTEQITETSGKGTNAGRVAAAAAAGAVVVGGGGAAVYVTMIKGKFKFK